MGHLSVDSNGLGGMEQQQQAWTRNSSSNCASLPCGCTLRMREQRGVSRERPGDELVAEAARSLATHAAPMMKQEEDAAGCMQNPWSHCRPRGLRRAPRHDAVACQPVPCS